MPPASQHVAVGEVELPEMGLNPMSAAEGSASNGPSLHASSHSGMTTAPGCQSPARLCQPRTGVHPLAVAAWVLGIAAFSVVVRMENGRLARAIVTTVLALLWLACSLTWMWLFYIPERAKTVRGSILSGQIAFFCLLNAVVTIGWAHPPDVATWWGRMEKVAGQITALGMPFVTLGQDFCNSSLIESRMALFFLTLSSLFQIVGNLFL